MSYFWRGTQTPLLINQPMGKGHLRSPMPNSWTLKNIAKHLNPWISIVFFWSLNSENQSSNFIVCLITDDHCLLRLPEESGCTSTDFKWVLWTWGRIPAYRGYFHDYTQVHPQAMVIYLIFEVKLNYMYWLSKKYIMKRWEKEHLFYKTTSTFRKRLLTPLLNNPSNTPQQRKANV